LACFNWDIEERSLRTRRTFFLFHYWGTCWTSLAFVIINVIYVIFLAWLALFCCEIEVKREITCDTSFISRKR
jgi:hypothetical protein